MMLMLKTEQALCAIAEEIACEMKDADGEGIAEMAMDARRLQMAGFAEEQADLDAAIAEHGYPAVLTYMATRVPTW